MTGISDDLDLLLTLSSRSQSVMEVHSHSVMEVHSHPVMEVDSHPVTSQHTAGEVSKISSLDILVKAANNFHKLYKWEGEC